MDEAVKSRQQKAWELCVILWYLFYLGSQVSVYPFLTAWFASDNGPGPLNPRQLGYIGCARPWIMVPASFLWGMLADRFNAHRAILLGCMISATISRCLLYWSEGFTQVMVLMLLMQVLSSPVMMLADAMVNAACTKEGDYGVLRKWGAVGWGGMSFVSGAFIDWYGMTAAFGLHVLLILPCLYFSWMLHSYGKSKKAPQKGIEEINLSQGGKFSQKQELSLTNVSESNGIPRNGFAPHDGMECKEQCKGPTENGLGEANHTQHTAGAAHQTQQQEHKRRIDHLVQEGEQEDKDESCREGGSLHPTDSLSQSEDDGMGDRSQEHEHLLNKVQHAHPAAASHHHLAPAKLKGGSAHGETPWSSVAEPSFSDKLRAMFSSWHIVLFLLQATLFGYGFGTIESFLFVFLQELGANSTLMGLTLTITCLAEVPIFQLTGWLVGKLGAPRLMQITMACYAIRMFYYAVLPKIGIVWAVLPIEVLHGITFGLGWCVGTTMCRRLAPPGMTATMQGVFQACYFGFGYGCGALAGGFISHAYGFPIMFAASATIVCGVASAILIARCFAGPSPYDVNPDESDHSLENRDIEIDQRQHHGSDGGLGEVNDQGGRQWAQGVKNWFGRGHAAGGGQHYVGLASQELSQHKRGESNEGSNV
ncbi:major facilitator superfamily domain-containing protein [Dunaliella salina]|uniref:Major facilitator superfamily domain-containing protein n=1 Tax=Dunaliella salina TaxID=3046 RepID=A0ABQ7GFX4_DUNSA|nr:major facilitator superfamily domain-containing protein [Dunaliella salina]|eukprot:KAF5833496.1 major facilitator superfamily domain-containing protein [Dunaliella salina]